ncbi:MAG: MoxR family ATPase [Trueperaceae bacterium]|nr:MoxR family ATPase [Trueperaceae bacterium]
MPGAGDADAQALHATLERLHRGRDAIAQVVMGQENAVDEVLIALIAGGHVLIESAPGLGKTLLVRTLGRVFGLASNRVQFTPDLMPADITGTFSLTPSEHGTMEPRFQPGPIFAQMVLADEINRATPKTQAALLEAMQEGTVTVMGAEHPLPVPCFVLATQNPIEMEGTYLLPEAQIDRFLFKIDVPFPPREVLARIVETTTGNDVADVPQVLTPEDVLDVQRWARDVPVSTEIVDVVTRLVRATQPDLEEAPDLVRTYVRHGVSPRGAQSLVLAAKARALLAGRHAVAVDDVRGVSRPALRHRIHMNFEARADGVTTDAVVRALLDSVVASHA